jgi:hypothetical protein
MDDRRFDNLARIAAALPSRRHLVRALLGGASGLLLAAGVAEEAAARKCKKDNDCPGCQTCNRKKKKCGKGCGKGKRCCGGECVKEKLCCKTPEDCSSCQLCVDGRCQPNPAKNGQQCSGCLTCNNGACGSGDDALCKDHERCRQSTGICCAKCLANESCCPVGRTCINPGALSPNSCCDTSINTACGHNGDGTFRKCCSNFNERCVNNECVPKDECPTGRLTIEGVCCPFGPPCNGVCCGENEECSVDDVCENPFVCPRPFCSNRGLLCCPPNSFTDTAYCCPAEAACRNTTFGCSSD